MCLKLKLCSRCLFLALLDKIVARQLLQRVHHHLSFQVLDQFEHGGNPEGAANNRGCLQDLLFDGGE
jgi:hypothetical protein